MTLKVLLSSSPSQSLESLLERLTSLPAWKPFDDRAMKFVSKFAQKVLITPGVRNFPELAALGHWFRQAALFEMAKSSNPPTKGQIQVGRGLAFHLAPSNVDSVFMYSWLLSLLAGNVNLVRVSQKGSDQQNFLLNILEEMSHMQEYGEVLSRIILLTYPHDNEITKQISEACMVRVIWGGDATVQAIRSIPLRPMATELCFADRFSVAALSAKAIKEVGENVLREIIQGFYNDTYWFAQQACSSPRMVAWIGCNSEIEIAKDRFWPALTEEVRLREAENSSAMVMARLGAVFEYAGRGLGRMPNESAIDDFPSRIELISNGLSGARSLHCGNGLFLQISIKSLVELGQKLTDKEQTLTVYGFSEQDYRDLIYALPARALDRIVPVGSALAFNEIWDGQSLIRSFTRIICLP